MNVNQDDDDAFADLRPAITNLMTPVAAGAQRSSTKPAVKPPPKTDNTTIWAPPKPIMGGLLQLSEKEYMAWTGGKPKVDWSGLDDEKPSFVTAPVYRPVGYKSVTSHNDRVTPLKHRFSRNSELEVFVTAVANHLKQNGLDTISYLPDPADETEMKSVVEHHGRYTKEYTKRQTTSI